MQELIGAGRPARLRFTPFDFVILEMGEYVLCSVTQAPIPLHALCYWNADRQEAYANSEVAFLRACEIEKREKA